MLKGCFDPVASLSSLHTPLCVRWIPGHPKLLSLGCLPDGKGYIELLTLTMPGTSDVGGRLTCSGAITYPYTIRCATLEASYQSSLVTGDFNGDVCAWDMEYLVQPTTAWSTNSAINSIDGVAAEVVVGTRDGDVLLYDLRLADKCIGGIRPIGSVECWSIAFGTAHSSNDYTVTAGYSNGTVVCFDLRMKRIIASLDLEDGVCYISRLPQGNSQLMLTMGLNSNIAFWNSHPFAGDTSVNVSTFKYDDSPTTLWCGMNFDSNTVGITTGNGDLAVLSIDYNDKDATGSVSVLNRHHISDSSLITCSVQSTFNALCATGDLYGNITVGLIS